MSRFDFGKIREKDKVLFTQELESSRSVKDEVKIFNKRFPEWLKSLEKLVIRVWAYIKGGKLDWQIMK